MKALPIPSVNAELIAYGAVALVGAALVFWILKGGGARSIGSAVGALPGNLAGGAVEGIGDSLGVPRTNASECDRALAEGRLWDASFACPAGRWLGGVFSSRTGPAPVNYGADTSGVPFY